LIYSFALRIASSHESVESLPEKQSIRNPLVKHLSKGEKAKKVEWISPEENKTHYLVSKARVFDWQVNKD
jgi:hypothetical protein